MTSGLSDVLQDISDARKMAVINNELLRLQVDIAALQETHLAGTGTLKEKDFTFFWQGKSAEDWREHGVWFAVRNTLLKMVEPGDKDPNAWWHSSFTPQMVQSLSSVLRLLLWHQQRKQRTSFIPISATSWRTYPPRKTSSSLKTSMHEWVPTTTHGLPASDTLELARSTITGSATASAWPTSTS